MLRPPTFVLTLAPPRCSPPGSATRARNSALTALCAAPFLWLAVAAVLLEPHSQRALELIFTDGKVIAAAQPVRLRSARRTIVVPAAQPVPPGAAPP